MKYFALIACSAVGFIVIIFIGQHAKTMKVVYFM